MYLKKSYDIFILSTIFLFLIFMTSCGSSGSSDPNTNPTDTTDTTISGKVLDAEVSSTVSSSIRSSRLSSTATTKKVFLDKNSNKTLDTGEPSSTLATDGTYSISVASSDLGKYPLVAIVGENILSTPATDSKSDIVISPVSTMVQNEIENKGLSKEAAKKSIQKQLGTEVDVLGDYTASTTDSTTQAERQKIQRIAKITSNYIQKMKVKLTDLLGTEADTKFDKIVSIVIDTVIDSISEIMTIASNADNYDITTGELTSEALTQKAEPTKVFTQDDVESKIVEKEAQQSLADGNAKTILEGGAYGVYIDVHWENGQPQPKLKEELHFVENGTLSPKEREYSTSNGWPNAYSSHSDNDIIVTSDGSFIMQQDSVTSNGNEAYMTDSKGYSKTTIYIKEFDVSDKKIKDFITQERQGYKLVLKDDTVKFPSSSKVYQLKFKMEYFKDTYVVCGAINSAGIYTPTDTHFEYDSGTTIESVLNNYTSSNTTSYNSLYIAYINDDLGYVGTITNTDSKTIKIYKNNDGNKTIIGECNYEIKDIGGNNKALVFTNIPSNIPQSEVKCYLFLPNYTNSSGSTQALFVAGKYSPQGTSIENVDNDFQFNQTAVDAINEKIDYTKTLTSSEGKFYVYGGNEVIYGTDAYYTNISENTKFTKLGELDCSATASGTQTNFTGSYKYYVITTNKMVKIDRVKGSDGIYYIPYATGNTQNYGNLNIDNNKAIIGSVNSGGYIVIMGPATKLTSITVIK